MNMAGKSWWPLPSKPRGPVGTGLPDPGSHQQCCRAHLNGAPVAMRAELDLAEHHQHPNPISEQFLQSLSQG